MLFVAAHIVLAFALFRLVNWVGEHATDFGYASTTLFEEPNESIALNFFIRALAPSVFIVALSAASVAAGYPQFRIGIYWIVIYYYAMRLLFILVMNMHRLVSWRRFALHSGVGLLATYFVYKKLIIPNQSLLPNMDMAGNELWLAIFAFLYAAANKIKTSGGPGAKRRNDFIRSNYNRAKILYGSVINEEIGDAQLRLIAYSILIYENYCRPPSMRILERLLFWKDQRTTGIMQVASSLPLTDIESVRLGSKKLAESWLQRTDEDLLSRTMNTITDYNKDRDYLSRVFDVMDILANRVEDQFAQPYSAIFTSGE